MAAPPMPRPGRVAAMRIAGTAGEGATERRAGVARGTVRIAARPLLPESTRAHVRPPRSGTRAAALDPAMSGEIDGGSRDVSRGCVHGGEGRGRHSPPRCDQQCPDPSRPDSLLVRIPPNYPCTHTQPRQLREQHHLRQLGLPITTPCTEEHRAYEAWGSAQDYGSHDTLTQLGDTRSSSSRQVNRDRPRRASKGTPVNPNLRTVSLDTRSYSEVVTSKPRDEVRPSPCHVRPHESTGRSTSHREDATLRPMYQRESSDASSDLADQQHVS